MPKKRKNPLVRCKHYTWGIVRKTTGVFEGDGRMNGTMRRPSLGDGTLDEAIEKLHKYDALVAFENGLITRDELLNEQAESITISEGWARYMAHVESQVELEQRAENTVARYRTVQEKFGEFCRARSVHKVTGINRRVLDDYIAHLNGRRKTAVGRPYAYATVDTEITIIKQVTNFLKEEGFVPERFRLKFPLSKPEGNLRYCFTEEQFRAMLELAKAQSRTEWLYPVMYALGLTGLRINELRSLRITDLDWESMQISLKDGRYSPRIEGGEVRRLKGKRSRSLPILSELGPVLRAIPQHEDGYLFHGPKGARIRDRRVLETLQEHIIAPLASRFPSPAGEVGFADGVTHSFRHFFCSTMANRGVPEQMIMSWLGHRSSRMIRHYYTLHSEAAQAAVQGIRIVPAAVAAGSPTAARELAGDPQVACRDAQGERREPKTGAEKAPLDAAD